MAKARQVGMPHRLQLVPGRRLKISSCGGFFRVSKEGALLPVHDERRYGNQGKRQGRVYTLAGGADGVLHR
jgi:hypothetical protein